MKRNGCSNVWKRVCIAGLMIADGVAARADENDQTWLTGTVKAGVTSNLTLRVSSQQRYRDGDHYYRHMDYGADYKLNKDWSIGAMFRDQISKSKSGQWRTTSGYILDVVNTVKGGGAELKSRLRFIVCDPNYSGGECSTDFRPRFDLLPAKGFTTWNLKPYVADEIMYNFEDSNLYRNRLSFGLKCNPVKPLTVDLSLMYETTETNEQWAENWNPCLAATWSF